MLAKNKPLETNEVADQVTESAHQDEANYKRL
eukprot:CAMPEP_0176403260 /NCGR_PEP_ID=MMETSP0126-20121128/49954_1 /TAXON_ID=141414 ORGANISM="Strombidinopsis acuminatum, Strain SPMC142" /NCGR_SAMPLE_ID=MMETSP0126 /ASSEMBLY_ACC=CAM_ASM_000229 /LENGTH=31 /DNA_ID= /DNA_START= /DNA_END= /DNA_ORIENTATION=